MSTEISTKPQSTNIQFNFFDADQFAVMQRICTMFSNSELVPEMYKTSEKNPVHKAVANCMIAIETAQRIGASPLMVMQNMVIIYGKPSWSAKFLIATVNSCGRFKPLKYRFQSFGEIKDVEYTDYVWNPSANKKLPQTKKFAGPIENLQCIAYTTEKGSEEIMESIPVSIEMAIKEGWYTKDGSKWKTMARLMLQYRCATYWTSAFAPELSMGMKTTEEIIDIEDITYEDVSVRVKNEINEKGNKKPLSFDDENNGNVAASSDNPKKEAEKQSEETKNNNQNAESNPDGLLKKNDSEPGY